MAKDTKSSKKKLWVVLASVAIGLSIIITLLYVFTPVRFVIDHYFRPNYAEEVAKPVEDALLKAGAVKKCSTGNNTWEPTEHKASYMAIYEVPTSRDDAINFINNSIGQTGFQLTPNTPPPTPEDNLFYKDDSKQSTYSDLEEGNIQLLLTVWGSKQHDPANKSGCTFKEGKPANGTTIDLTVNLPRLKRQ